ncbi:MAG TPA: type IV toxin-antitoxin system AbiEi family antitoxin, partial [Smithella sp.]|nr:type IV toxin-antitoxin system AbiEi family antitoxin [Smithella sp.]
VRHDAKLEHNYFLMENLGKMLFEFVQNLVAKGRSSFCFEDVAKLKDSSPEAIRAALRRLMKKGDIAMPYRGFYVIVPPEYRIAGCLPPEQFIPDLMEHVSEVYYTGLLSAAEYYGAAHQRPQVFQVVVARSRRPIACGKMRVDFVFRKNAAIIPKEKINTPAGELQLSSPEATALDLVGYVHHCAGLDNVATVLAELAEKIDAEKLRNLADLSPIAWVQRLGYLLELVDAKDKAQGIAGYVKEKHPVRAPLVPALAHTGAKMDSRWRVFINTKVEPDL